MSDIHQRAINWVVGDDTGLSSQALWGHMMGATKPPRYGWNHPHDPDDLGRCLRLLELIPEWKRRLPEMAQRSVYWERLVAIWDEIAASMEEEVGIHWEKARSAPKTYALMRTALDLPTPSHDREDGG